MWARQKSRKTLRTLEGGASDDDVSIDGEHVCLTNPPHARLGYYSTSGISGVLV